MAVDLENRGSLLLPSEFEAEENTILSVTSKPIAPSWTPCFGSSDSVSTLSSPVESELCSTQSESDQDDDYIAELTRRMAHYMLQDDENKPEKTWSTADSPQSKAWTRLDSSLEEMPIMEKFDKLKINEDTFNYNNSDGFLGTNLEPCSVPLTMRKSNSPSVEFHTKQALIDEQIRSFQLKAEEIMKQQESSLNWGRQANCYKQNQAKQQSRHFQSKGRQGYGNGQNASWATLQQKKRTGSEMTAVFLGDSGSRSGSCGTGVFLPRGIGTNPKSLKKSGNDQSNVPLRNYWICQDISGSSTVLIPARVVQALKLHFDRLGAESKSSTASLFPLQHDALMGDLRYEVKLQRKSQSRTAARATNNHQDMGLPQEWMY